MPSESKQKQPKKRLSRSTRAGLVMPVSRIHRFMRKANLSEHISAGASIYMAATLEYMLCELLIASSSVCEKMKMKRLTPRHITIAIRYDEDMFELLKNVVIPWGGVRPFIEPELIPPKLQPTYAPEY